MAKVLVKPKVRGFFTTEADAAYNLITESTNRSFVSRFIKQTGGTTENFFQTSGACFPIVTETTPNAVIHGGLQSVDGFHAVGYGTVVLSQRPVAVETGVGKMNGITGHDDYQPVIAPKEPGRFGQTTARLLSNNSMFGIPDEVIYDSVNPKLSGDYYLTFFIHKFGHALGPHQDEAIVGESYRLAIFAATSGWPGWLYTGYSSNKSNFRPLEGSVLNGLGAKYMLAIASSTPLVTYYNQHLASYSTTMLDTAMFTSEVVQKPPAIIGINNAAIQMALLSANLSFINELSLQSREIASKTVVANSDAGFAEMMQLVNQAPYVAELFEPGVLGATSWEDLRRGYLAWERNQLIKAGHQSVDIQNAVQANSNGVLEQIAAGVSGNPIVPRAMAAKLLNNSASIVQALRIDFKHVNAVRSYTAGLRQTLQPQGLKREREAPIMTHGVPEKPAQAAKATKQQSLEQREKLKSARDAILARFGGAAAPSRPGAASTSEDS